MIVGDHDPDVPFALFGNLRALLLDILNVFNRRQAVRHIYLFDSDSILYGSSTWINSGIRSEEGSDSTYFLVKVAGVYTKGFRRGTATPQRRLRRTGLLYR